ncbi:C-type lectin domain family 3 member A-like isoform X2 [Biomphalaria glabrata]|nr:C-type lectin domain family 3 member A-like isoform X2 [Biomphalaria glabrata]
MELFLVFIYLFCYQIYSVQCLQLTTSPRVILQDATDKLVVNCTYDTGSDSSLTSLTSLTVSRLSNLSSFQYQVLSSVDSFTGVTTSQENLTSAGLIDNTGQSYLTLTWNNPLTITQGDYKCDAIGLNSAGQPLTLSSTVNVTDVSSEIDHLKAEIVQLRNTIGYLETQFQTLFRNTSSFMSTWSERINGAQKTLFETSEIYNGSQYYLYKDSPSLIPLVAEATCQIYGGHLAELQTSDEYDYVISFIENFSWVRFLLVGGSQYGEAGNWVYPHSNESLHYFRWAEAFPFYNMAHDCLILWDVYNWNMTNQLCTMDQSQWPIYYLCEVEI